MGREIISALHLKCDICASETIVKEPDQPTSWDVHCQDGKDRVFCGSCKSRIVGVIPVYDYDHNVYGQLSFRKTRSIYEPRLICNLTCSGDQNDNKCSEEFYLSLHELKTLLEEVQKLA